MSVIISSCNDEEKGAPTTLNISADKTAVSGIEFKLVLVFIKCLSSLLRDE